MMMTEEEEGGCLLVGCVGGGGWLHRQQCFKMTKFLEINQIKKMISLAFFWNTTTLKNKMFFLQMFSIENILQ